MRIGYIDRVGVPYKFGSWKDAARNLQVLKNGTPVLMGGLGCLTDDCQHWNDDTCKRGAPCMIGRKITVAEAQKERG